MSSTTKDTTEATSISGVMVPDSKLAREVTELVRDTESPLLFNCDLCGRFQSVGQTGLSARVKWIVSSIRSPSRKRASSGRETRSRNEFPSIRSLIESPYPFTGLNPDMCLAP
jgi:hypothetical protein